jgi:hypothetical protein
MLSLSDLEPRSFKYIGAGIAALYGIFATVTDFHEEKNGRRVLSHRGYFGLVLLAIASMMTISSDWSKDKHEDVVAAEKKRLDEERFASAQARQENMTRQINENLKTSSQVSKALATAQKDLKKSLRVVAETSAVTTKMLAQERQSSQITEDILIEAQRANDLLKPKQMRLEVSISTAPSAELYLGRLVEQLPEFIRKHPYVAIRGSKEWPSFEKAEERGLFILVSSSIGVGFTDAKSLGLGESPLLSIGRLCENDSTTLGGFVPESFAMYCGLVSTEIGTNRGHLISHIDLADKIVVLELKPPREADDYRANWEELDNVLPAGISAALRITESDEKVYIFDGEWKRCGRRDSTIYCHFVTSTDLVPKT